MKDSRQMNVVMLNTDIAGIERKGKYRLIGKKDAELLFGAHKGEKISEMIETSDGKNYLIWIMSTDFPDELVKIIKYIWDNNVMVENDGC
jgi:hypothetical protein